MFYTGQTNTTIYGFRNASANLTCYVHAYPEAYFIWYRNKIPMDPKDHPIKIYNEENTSILEVRQLGSCNQCFHAFYSVIATQDD